MSDWDETTKQRVRELVTIETAEILIDREDMEPEHVRRVIEIRKGIGLDPAATERLEEILKWLQKDGE